MSTNPETKKSTVPALLAAVFVVAALAAGGLVVMTTNGEAQNKGAAQAEAGASPAAGDATAATTQEPAIKLGNPVVAVVNGEQVMRADVFNFISGLPEQVRQMPIQNLFPLAQDQVINNRIIAEKAKGAKLEDDAEVKQLVDQAKGQIVRNVFIERQLTAAISQKDVLKAYEDTLTEVAKIQETSARHILVDTEDKAKEITKKLDEGAKFDEMVNQYSMGPSKENGGRLGYFAKNEMVPAFAEAAFALDVGKYTKDPVKTDFGYHVITVEDRRQRPEPKFEDIKPQLEAMLRQRKLAEMIEGWQKSAKIERFDINGEKVKAAKDAKKN